MARRVTSVATPTAHLVGPGRIRVVNGQLAYAAEEIQPLRLEPRELELVLCYGDVGVTGEALALLFAHRVEVAWLTLAGQRCRGRLVRSDAARTRLRILQHHYLSEPALVLEWARSVVVRKINAQIECARHYQRHGQEEAGRGRSALLALARSAREVATLEEVRGIEGSASACWFRLLGGLFQSGWSFGQRVRRPPTDPVNALLSLGYTWLLARTVARVEASGLEVGLGGLHSYHPGRPSLACDLMEPLRTAVDRWVVMLCNRNQVRHEDFVRQPSGGVRLGPGVMARVLLSWEKYWTEQGLQDNLEGEVRGFVSRLRSVAQEDSGLGGEDRLDP
jgi:CRISPR-associated protein Cas1